MISAFLCLLQRDLTLALRSKTEILTATFFFIIVVSLFPLGVGPEKEMLRAMAPGVIWVAALLASMLSLHRLFSDDYADGSLEQLILTPQPLSILVLAKIMAHWLVAGVPLVVIAPVLGLQFGLDGTDVGVLTLMLLLGTPVLSLLGSIGAALTIGVRGGGMLVSLLILPLYVPVLIFGASAVDAYQSGLGIEAHVSLLGAFLVLALVFAPWATAAAVRISTE